jgi:hypothetical protein
MLTVHQNPFWEVIMTVIRHWQDIHKNKTRLDKINREILRTRVNYKLLSKLSTFMWKEVNHKVDTQLSDKTMPRL